MPELAELTRMAAVFNRAARDRLFVGVKGSDVWKRDPLPPADWPSWPEKPWRLSAVSRGKELLVTIQSEQPGEPLRVRLNMGMSGTIRWEPRLGGVEPKQEKDRSNAAVELKQEEAQQDKCEEDSESNEDNDDERPQRQYKHAHLEFEAADGWIVFVDPRRFGRITWAPTEANGWSADRSPCPVTEYDDFCRHIADSVSAFENSRRVVADVLHDQKYFNGIGNYLRAEILHRVGVGPMVPFLAALRHCEPRDKPDGDGDDESVVITAANRLLMACRDLPLEVLALPEVDESEAQPSDYIGGRPFENWLRVYGKGASKTMRIGGQTFWWLGSKTKRLQPDQLSPPRRAKRAEVEQTKSEKKGATRKKQRV